MYELKHKVVANLFRFLFHAIRRLLLPWLLCQVERTEAQHELELKGASKKIRADQEKELRAFRESLKTELKLLKQEVDLLPKDVRKETLRNRKEHLESDQAHREKVFLERLHQNHEVRIITWHGCPSVILAVAVPSFRFTFLFYLLLWGWDSQCVNSVQLITLLSQPCSFPPFCFRHLFFGLIAPDNSYP